MKIPGYTNIKLKVKNIEAKDNVSILTASLTLWPNLDVDFYNNTSIYGDEPDNYPGIGKSTSQDYLQWKCSTISLQSDLNTLRP